MNYEITPEEVAAIRSLQDKLFGLATSMGWHEKPREIGTMIALCHSELSEALEGARRNLMDKHLKCRKSVEVELADCVIRILDFAGRENLDLAGAIAEKHAYNAIRPDHKKENRARRAGKKF